jgi:hypothetical protein
LSRGWLGRANSFTEALLDAGQPEGIAPGSEIESCEPHLEDVDISDVSTGEIFSQSSVKILKSGSS